MAVSRPAARRRRSSLPRLAVLVALGGTAGTAARAHLEAALPAQAGAWPWTTFLINVAGSFLLGVLLESLLRGGEDTSWRRAVRVGCGTGLVGGFTTYSTFILEVERLLQGGHATVGVLYALVSVVAGLAAAGIGVAIAEARSRSHEPRRAGA
ncbi:CrcB family protein [Georgenia sp. EYE_87]|uniref:FluC/FEX family fluoride channel n=1 Tax=Georgenia sp. EYE_87 TaxID=2853448 RepID=UPI0020066C7E|nr:CrcB family protein [Georgenia sp. EYE_87]